MPTITLITEIKAPVQRCFDLSRSIDVHMVSTEGTNEKAVEGVITGLIREGETVTWRARHLGVYHQLTTLISQMDAPFSFTDEQLSGPFRRIHHRHLFEQKGELTVMTDIFHFESPFGWIGKIFDRLFLENYLRRFLSRRNAVVKRMAETEEWKQYL